VGVGAHLFFTPFAVGGGRAGPPLYRGSSVNSADLEIVVGPEIEALGFECVKLEIVGSARSPIVRIYIDKEGSVTIKHCAMVSRAIGLVLDRLDPFPGRYLLEVSSPGNARPLAREQHFARFAGREARVECDEGDAGKKTYTGRIRSCINGLLVLDAEEGERIVRFSDIVKAHLCPQEYKIDKKQKDFKDKKDGVK